MSETQYQQGRWALSDLISTPEGQAMDAVFNDLEKAVAETEGLRKSLTPSIDKTSFARTLKLVERVGYLERQLSGYATLWLSELTSHSEALAFQGRIDKLLADAQNRTLFFELWWQKLDAQVAEGLGNVDLHAAGMYSSFCHDLRWHVIEGSHKKPDITNSFSCCESGFVIQTIQIGSGGAGVGHVQHGGKTPSQSGACTRKEIFFVGGSGFTKVDVRVDEAWDADQWHVFSTINPLDGRERSLRRVCLVSSCINRLVWKYVRLSIQNGSKLPGI
jgi:hypothetical protein